jgi:hypothetical protein
MNIKLLILVTIILLGISGSGFLFAADPASPIAKPTSNLTAVPAGGQNVTAQPPKEEIRKAVTDFLGVVNTTYSCGGNTVLYIGPDKNTTTKKLLITKSTSGVILSKGSSVKTGSFLSGKYRQLRAGEGCVDGFLRIDGVITSYNVTTASGAPGINKPSSNETAPQTLDKSYDEKLSDLSSLLQKTKTDWQYQDEQLKQQQRIRQQDAIGNTLPGKYFGSKVDGFGQAGGGDFSKAFKTLFGSWWK